MNNFLEWLEQKHPEYLNENQGLVKAGEFVVKHLGNLFSKFGKGIRPSGFTNSGSLQPNSEDYKERENVLRNYLPVTNEDIDNLPLSDDKKEKIKKYYNFTNIFADTWSSGWLSDRTLAASLFPFSDARAQWLAASNEFEFIRIEKGWIHGQKAGWLYGSNIWFRPKTATEKLADARLTVKQLQNKIKGLIDKDQMNMTLQAKKISDLYSRDRKITPNPLDADIDYKNDFVQNYVPLDPKYINDKYITTQPKKAKLAVNYLFKQMTHNELINNPLDWIGSFASTVTRDEQVAWKDIKDLEYNDKNDYIEWKQFGYRWYRTKTKQEKIADATKKISELKAQMGELEKKADKSVTGLSALTQLEKYRDDLNDKANSIVEKEKEMIKSGKYMLDQKGELLRDRNGNPIPLKKDTKSKDRYPTIDPKDDIYRSEEPPITPRPRSESESEPVNPFKVLPTRPASKRPAGSSTKNNNNPYANRR
jgi:hypothetical protein